MLAKENLVYLDTCITSLLSDEEQNWEKFKKEYLCSKKLLLAISGSQLAEISDKTKTHHKIARLILDAPSALIKLDEILGEEVNAYPAYRQDTLILRSLEELKYQENGVQVIKDFLTSSKLKKLRKWQNEVKLGEFEKRLLANKKNFPPRKNGKYDKDQASEFEYQMVVQWLTLYHPNFIENHIRDLDIRSFLSVRIFALYLFYKYYIESRDTKKGDFLDLHHIMPLPYCKVAIVEKDMCAILRNIKKNHDVLKGVTIDKMASIRGL